MRLFPRIAILCLGLIAAAIAPFFELSRVTGNALRSCRDVMVSWFRSVPSDALALDRLTAPVRVLPAMRSRFIAFTQRLGLRERQVGGWWVLPGLAC